MAEAKTTSVSPGTDAAVTSPPAFNTPNFGGESPPAIHVSTASTEDTLAADRLADEWDAAKVPPSRFQKRKGSIYATPNSRDGQVSTNYADKYHAKLAEMNKK